MQSIAPSEHALLKVVRLHTTCRRTPRHEIRPCLPVSARTISVVRIPGRTVLLLIAVVVVCGGTAAVIVSVHSSKHPVDTATLLAADLAAGALAITVLTPVGAWWRKGRQSDAVQASTPSQVAKAADRLAGQVTDQWQQEATRRRIVTPAPVAVRWHWATDMATRQDVTATPAPGAGPRPLPGSGEPVQVLASGVVIRLHDELYAKLPHGRLVLLGGPGAGKTGAMILLMLAALKGRADLKDAKERARVPAQDLGAAVAG